MWWYVLLIPALSAHQIIDLEKPNFLLRYVIVHSPVPVLNNYLSLLVAIREGNDGIV